MDSQSPHMGGAIVTELIVRYHLPNNTNVQQWLFLILADKDIGEMIHYYQKYKLMKSMCFGFISVAIISYPDKK